MKKVRKNIFSKYIRSTKTIVSLVLVIPIVLTFFTVRYYNNSYKKIETELTEIKGNVAGAKIKNVSDLTKIIPMMPKTKITSVDTSNNQIHITLEAEENPEEVKTFYEDYFYTNGWKQTQSSIYEKGVQKIECKIEGQVIDLILTGFD